MRDKKEPEYVTALNYEWLTPLYDPLSRLSGEPKRQRRLLDAAEIRAGDRILDVGCGTGTFLVMAKKAQPQAHFFGLDGDAKILAIARKKMQKLELEVQLDEAMAFDMPYPDSHFDRIVSNLVLHHLTTENKQRTFHEMYRVLRPGGSIAISDFGPPSGRFITLFSKIFKRFEQVSDNLEGLLPVFAAQAGFLDVRMRDHSNSLFGTIWILKATKPS